MCIGAFMGQLDASIAQLVLPELERQFRNSLGGISWVFWLNRAGALPRAGLRRLSRN